MSAGPLVTIVQVVQAAPNYWTTVVLTCGHTVVVRRRVDRIRPGRSAAYCYRCGPARRTARRRPGG